MKEVSKEKYEEIVNSGDHVFSSSRDYSEWRTRYGVLIAKDTAGYVPSNKPTKYFVTMDRE